MSLTAVAFVGIYCLGLVFSFQRPIYGLAAYLWAFYNHPQGRWWGLDLPDLRWSLIAAVVTLIATMLSRSSGTRPAWHASWGVRLLILFVLWVWLQSLWAVKQAYHIEGAILFTKYLVLYFLIYRAVSDTNLFERFSFGHIFGCLIFGWVAYQNAGPGRLEDVGGPGLQDANMLAGHIATGLVFAGIVFLNCRGTKRWLSFATIPFMLNGIILTGSRGAFVSLLGAGVAVLYLVPKTSRRIVYGLSGLAVVLLLILGHELFWERMLSILETDKSGKREASAQSRIDLVGYGWEMAKDYPLGAGHRGHQVLSPDYMPESLLTNVGGVVGRSAHNTFLAVLVEHGFVGAVLYLGIMIWVIRTLFRLRALDAQALPPSLGLYRAALGGALAVLFFSGLFVNALKAEVGVWLLALLAILSQISHDSIRGHDELGPREGRQKAVGEHSGNMRS